jgi:Domain of unknown function (DUF4124)
LSAPTPLPRNLALKSVAMGVAALAFSVGVAAQSGGVAKGGIYSCTDSKGRRITSDRPIVECLDREQLERSGSGVVRRVVPPSYTAEERAHREAQQKAEEAARARVAEDKRRERALLIRYPHQGLHDEARADAVAQVDAVIAAVKKRVEELTQQRKDIDTELEFHQNDINKAPAWLKRKFDDNVQQIAIQNRFLADQVREKQQLNARFDEELVKLRSLWSSK